MARFAFWFAKEGLSNRGLFYRIRRAWATKVAYAAMRAAFEAARREAIAKGRYEQGKDPLLVDTSIMQESRGTSDKAFDVTYAASMRATGYWPD